MQSNQPSSQGRRNREDSRHARFIAVVVAVAVVAAAVGVCLPLPRPLTSAKPSRESRGGGWLFREINGWVLQLIELHTW